jgi:hypothetical protein
VTDEAPLKETRRIASDIPVPFAIQRIADSADRRLAWYFFVFFSRMEYALKRTPRYLRNTENAEPDWDQFGEDHDEEFRQAPSTQVKSAVEYFEKTPPRKQIQKERRMDWKEPTSRKPTEKQLTWVLLKIRTVRNNLFHGGKFPLMPIRDPSRDRDLLEHSLVILNAALELDKEVKSNFFEHLDDH